MGEAGVEILFLADRLGNRSDLQSLEALAGGLSRLGHDCHFLCVSAPSDHGLGDLVECPGLARRWQRPWTVRGLDLEAEPGRPRIMHVLSARMAEAALAIAERWKIPYVLGVEEFPRREFRLRLSRVWCRGLVVPNRELAVALSRDYGIPSGAILEVARGVAELEKPIRPTSFGPGRVPVVGSAGDLVASSGLTTFLNAARKVVDSGLDVEFLIAGQGEDEGDLRRRAERLRIAERLTFAADLPVGVSSWDVLDVFCQTSMAPTVGRPLLMAQACGVPSIATDVEGLRSLIEPGQTGLVVPHGDASALALAILELLQNHELARHLGESARRAVAREHHPAREAGRLDYLYRDLLATQESGPTSRPSEPAADDRIEGEAFPRLSGGSGS